MPKERSERSVSHDRHNSSPFTSNSSGSRQSSKAPTDSEANVKEWEEARCPVCMEHPHNAVLLICSSHEKGCRPYMCDTSYRHSNCLDQFRKSVTESSSLSEQETMPPTTPADTSETTTNVIQEERTEVDPSTEHTISCENHLKAKLVCPLCRGQIKEWVVMDAARSFMNAKSRNCSCETCSFSGAYADLRNHARVEHPTVRPSVVDPERQHNWRRLENQRDLGDLLSTLQSSLGEERSSEGSSVLPIDDGGWLTVYFLIRVFRPGSRSRSSTLSGNTRARSQPSATRRSTRLWGESYDGDTASSREEENESSDEDSGPQRRRQRTRRRTTPDDQP